VDWDRKGLRMTSAADVADFIAAQPAMLDRLIALASLCLPDAWIGAGFVHNAVWDALHGRVPGVAGLADMDVVFFDPADLGSEREEAVEGALAALRPGVHWSARNQARMHRCNADPPYRDTADAMRHWPETATAVVVRLRAGRVELLMPHGIEDLVRLVLRPPPTTASRPGHLEVYRQRVEAKGWVRRWPSLTVGCSATI